MLQTLTRLIPRPFSSQETEQLVKPNSIAENLEAYQRTYVLDGFEEDSLDLIFYVLKGSLAESLSKVVSGSTMPYIRKGDLERFPIPLPPLPEQKKIAHILSTVQRAIEAQERIIQTTTELKKTLMHKLFTEGTPQRTPKTNRNRPRARELGGFALGKFSVGRTIPAFP